MRITRLLHDPEALSSASLQILLHALQLDHGNYPIGEGSPGQDESRKSMRYQNVKMVLLTLEQSAQFSTNSLAACLLLALHEIGHGIFPAAYLTLGSVARLFCALGLHDRKKATQILQYPGKFHQIHLGLEEAAANLFPATWTETEERRRLWWAIMILDRYVHVSFRFRPLCTPKIPPEEILPGRDAAWDAGVSFVPQNNGT